MPEAPETRTGGEQGEHGEQDQTGEPGEPLQRHGDPLLAAAMGSPQGDGSRHGFDARDPERQAGRHGDGREHQDGQPEGEDPVV